MTHIATYPAERTTDAWTNPVNRIVIGTVSLFYCRDIVVPVSIVQDERGFVSSDFLSVRFTGHYHAPPVQASTEAHWYRCVANRSMR